MLGRVGVCVTKDKGRGLYATDDIKSGDVIIDSEAPFACSFPSEITALTHGIVYRDQKIRYAESSSTQGSTHVSVTAPNLVLLTARALETNPEEVWNLCRPGNTVDNDGYSVMSTCGNTRTTVYKEKKQTEWVANLLQSAHVANFISTSSTSSLSPPAVLSKEQCTDALLRLSCNAFALSDTGTHTSTNTEVETNVSTRGDGGGGVWAVGLAVYRLASCLNHSCSPNATQSFHHCLDAVASDKHVIDETPKQEQEHEQDCCRSHSNVNISITADRDIAAGEEICISYVDITKARWVRQQVLWEKYGFICQCPRCLVPDINDTIICPSNLILRGMCACYQKEQCNGELALALGSSPGCDSCGADCFAADVTDVTVDVTTQSSTAGASYECYQLVSLQSQEWTDGQQLTPGSPTEAAAAEVVTSHSGGSSSDDDSSESFSRFLRDLSFPFGFAWERLRRQRFAHNLVATQSTSDLDSDSHLHPLSLPLRCTCCGEQCEADALGLLDKVEHVYSLWKQLDRLGEEPADVVEHGVSHIVGVGVGVNGNFTDYISDDDKQNRSQGQSHQECEFQQQLQQQEHAAICLLEEIVQFLMKELVHPNHYSVVAVCDKLTTLLQSVIERLQRQSHQEQNEEQSQQQQQLEELASKYIEYFELLMEALPQCYPKFDLIGSRKNA